MRFSLSKSYQLGKTELLHSGDKSPRKKKISLQFVNIQRGFDVRGLLLETCICILGLVKGLMVSKFIKRAFRSLVKTQIMSESGET